MVNKNKSFAKKKEVQMHAFRLVVDGFNI